METELPDTNVLKQALDLLWNMKVAEGEALLQKHLRQHPAFIVFYGEVGSMQDRVQIDTEPSTTHVIRACNSK
jgi:hypothetical protein